MQERPAWSQNPHSQFIPIPLISNALKDGGEAVLYGGKYIRNRMQPGPRVALGKPSGRRAADRKYAIFYAMLRNGHHISAAGSRNVR